MSQKKEKTGFGKFLQKAGKIIPGIVSVATKVGTGNIGGAFQEALGHLTGAEQTPEVVALTEEFMMKRLEWEMEMHRIDAEDRQSARDREIKMAQAGKFDFMLYLTGLSAIGIFGFLVYTLVYLQVPEPNRELFIHLMGIVEGIIISIYTFYFGSSNSSQKKDKATN